MALKIITALAILLWVAMMVALADYGLWLWTWV